MTLSMPSARERRQQVLDRLDRDRLARQPGLVLNAAKMRDRGRNLEAPKVGALKPDAVVGGRRLERQGDLVAGMKTDSGAGDGSAEGALRVHDLSDRTGESLSELSKRSASNSQIRHRCHKLLMYKDLVACAGTARGPAQSENCGLEATALSAGTVANLPQSMA